MIQTVLVDAGVLVAPVDNGQPQNDACRSITSTLPLPLVTTWAAYTEAMYLVFGLGGWPMQSDLWSYVTAGVVRLHMPGETEPSRMLHLMEQYRDRPMDLADATLVAAAETLDTKRVFTLNGDFYIYRFRGTEAFEVIGPSR